jgi:Putative glycosyl/glycerophosphate transferases involved in teichoic acid biosynthesis TagF/TagB/EpsJ/RodC
MRFKSRLKIMGISILRTLAHIFWIWPIRENRMVFHSHMGNGYECNPKYVCEALMKRTTGNYEIIWAVNDVADSSLPKEVKRVKYGSFKWMFYESTCKASILNDGGVWIPIREGQLRVNTWHGGGCYKKVGFQNDWLNVDKKDVMDKRLDMSSRETNLFLSSSSYFTENVIRKSFGYKGEVLNCGMPRNDMLVSDSLEQKVRCNEKIRNFFNLPADNVIVLFAPTYRVLLANDVCFDIDAVEDAVKKKYNRSVTILVRAHRKMVATLKNGKGILANHYPDMQELLVTSDILISDYSSSIWDYSFTGKPCFLYTPDLLQYRITPGFERDIFDWGFSVCNSNEELCKALADFDFEVHRKKMEEHHSELGSYEFGNATEQLLEYFEKFGCRGK